MPPSSTKVLSATCCVKKKKVMKSQPSLVTKPIEAFAAQSPPWLAGFFSVE